jgi:hypothetical protein
MISLVEIDEDLKTAAGECEAEDCWEMAREVAVLIVENYMIT